MVVLDISPTMDVTYGFVSGVAVALVGLVVAVFTAPSLEEKRVV